jgi:hypothetical protein
MKGAIFRYTVFNYLLLHALPRFYLQHNVTYVFRILITEHRVIV